MRRPCAGLGTIGVARFPSCDRRPLAPPLFLGVRARSPLRVRLRAQEWDTVRQFRLGVTCVASSMWHTVWRRNKTCIAVPCGFGSPCWKVCLRGYAPLGNREASSSTRATQLTPLKSRNSTHTHTHPRAPTHTHTQLNLHTSTPPSELTNSAHST